MNDKPIIIDGFKYPLNLEDLKKRLSSFKFIKLYSRITNNDLVAVQDFVTFIFGGKKNAEDFQNFMEKKYGELYGIDEVLKFIEKLVSFCGEDLKNLQAS